MHVLKSIILLRLEAWNFCTHASSNDRREAFSRQGRRRSRHQGGRRFRLEINNVCNNAALKAKKRPAGQTLKGSKAKVQRTGSTTDDQETQLPEGHPLLTANNAMAPSFSDGGEECRRKRRTH